MALGSTQRCKPVHSKSAARRSIAASRHTAGRERASAARPGVATRNVRLDEFSEQDKVSAFRERARTLGWKCTRGGRAAILLLDKGGASHRRRRRRDAMVLAAAPEAQGLNWSELLLE